jgi:hypothetical protein
MVNLTLTNNIIGETKSKGKGLGKQWVKSSLKTENSFYIFKWLAKIKRIFHDTKIK